MHFSFAQTALPVGPHPALNASPPAPALRRNATFNNMACFENMEWPDEKVLANVFALAWGGWLGNQTKPSPRRHMPTCPHPHCL